MPSIIIFLLLTKLTLNFISEDELTSKQTEISGLKNSVAELTSSRSGLEASLGTTQIELEGAKNR